nr:hypothetical protein [Campylobacterota bacterium]
MAVESYVDDILESSEAVFRRIMSTIIAKSDQNAKIELVRQYTIVDTVLFEAIKSILNDLKVEEGMISRFLYKYFNIEIFKNKKREQLIILGSQLKIQYSNLQEEKQRVMIHIESIMLSISNLERLKIAFENRRELLSQHSQLNKSNALIKKINAKIEELSGYHISLE